MANRIKQTQRKAIEEYIARVQMALNLADWRIHLLDEPTEESESADGPSTAQILTLETHHYAQLRIGDKFLTGEDLDDNMRTVTLIHEVLHLHFEYTWHTFLEVAHNTLTGQALQMAKYSFRCEIERGVDKLAWALAAMLPPFKLPA